MLVPFARRNGYGYEALRLIIDLWITRARLDRDQGGVKLEKYPNEDVDGKEVWLRT